MAFFFSFYNIISHIKCISFVSLFWALYPFRSTEPLSNIIRYICAYKQYIICRDQTNRILHNHFLDRNASQRINVNSFCLLNIVYESQVICRLGYTTLQCESLQLTTLYILVLPSTGFERTPLVHCSTYSIKIIANSLAPRPNSLLKIQLHYPR